MINENEVTHAVIKDGKVVDVLIFDITNPEIIEEFTNLLGADFIISLKDREDFIYAGIGNKWDGQSFSEKDPIPN